jgi:hypothetical protein
MPMESVKPFSEDYIQCRCEASNTSLKITSNADGMREAVSMKQSGEVRQLARDEEADGKRRAYSEARDRK